MNQNSPSNEDVAMYKRMIMMDQTNGGYQDSTDEFLGNRDNPPLSPYNPKKQRVTNGPHKWGPPQSSEQYRPDVWLTGGDKSPMSPRRSYHVKSPEGKSPARTVGTSPGSTPSWGVIPPLDLDDTVHSAATVNVHNSAKMASLPTVSTPHRSPRREVQSRGAATYSSSRWGGGCDDSQPMSPHERPPCSPVAGGRKTPPRVESISKLHEDSGTKIFSNEKIDTNDFAFAFTTFEGNNASSNAVGGVRQTSRTTDDVPARHWSAQPPTLSVGMSPHRPKGSRQILSSPNAARRNFSVPAVSPMTKAHLADGAPTYELANLSALISGLRKVSLDDTETRRKKNFGDRSDQQAAYLLEIITHLRKVTRTGKDGMTKSTAEEDALEDLIAKLRKTGVLNPNNLSPHDVSEVQKIIGRIRAVQERYPHQGFPYADLEGVIRDLENILVPSDTASSSRTAVVADSSRNNNKNVQETLEDVIGRLKKVTPRLANRVDKIEAEHATVALAELVDRLRDRDEKELAHVIRLLGSEGTQNGHEEENEGLKELRRVLSTLDELDGADTENVKRLLAGLNLPPADAEVVANCIQKLKKLNMTPKEAGAVAGIAAQLRTVGVGNTKGESDLDEQIGTLRDVLYPKQKMDEATRVLKSLRRIDMTADQRKVVADVIAKLGNKEGDNYKDVLAEAISKLRRAKLNKYEAKEVAGILINLRKTKYPNNDKDKHQMKMVTLRKVTTPEKANAIEAAIELIKKVQWNLDDDVFKSFVDEIVSLGRGEPTEKQLYQNELADAISRLKHVKMTPREARGVSGILFKLKKTKYPKEKEGDKKDDRWKLRKVIASPKVEQIEKALDQVKRVRWNLDDEVFVYFVDDVVSQALKDWGDEDDESVDTMDISISDDESDGDLMDSHHHENDTEKPAKFQEKHITMKTTLPKAQYSPKVSINQEEEKEEDENKKIVFTRKHHWKHKQFHGTVIGEKRWRTSEGFATDEVIYSPLSLEQYDRRKAVGASLKASMANFDVPLADESHVDEVERKLHENHLTLGLVEQHASSSKYSSLVNKSPKKAVQGMATMAAQPDFPSL